MTRAPLTLPALAGVLVAAPLSGQYPRGGFIAGGRGDVASPLHDARFSLHMGYLVEAGGRHGAWVAGRSVLGMSWLRPDQAAYAETYGPGTLTGGDGTLYDTGFDVQVGVGAGFVRAYGLVGIHLLYHAQETTTLTSPSGEERNLRPRRFESLGAGQGVGVELLVVENSGFTAEWYRTGKPG